jgi:hypothetical protein
MTKRVQLIIGMAVICMSFYAASSVKKGKKVIRNNTEISQHSATQKSFPGSAGNLDKGFKNPPESSRPQTFWHWMNGNVTKEGITADLEAMKEAGIGGVMLFIIEGQITESVPVYIDKPVRHLTPEWFSMIRHAASECKRLNLKLSIMNCIGWSASGGPWITPDKSMMRIAWSEKYFRGPGRITEPLSRPPCDYANYQNLTAIRSQIHESVPPEERFYRDVAVLAYRMDPSAARAAACWPPKLSCTKTGETLSNVVDGDGATKVSVNSMGFLQFDFGEPVTIRGLEYLGDNCELQALENNGTNWYKVTDLPGPRSSDYPQTLPVQETNAYRFRLFFRNGGSVKDIKLSGESLVKDYQSKASFHSAWEDSKIAEDRIGVPTPEWASTTIRSKDIINLTKFLKADGTLDWIAPEGDWMIVRIGYASIGKLNGPSAREFVGLECNKLDADAVEYHFNHYAGRVADELKDLIGSGFHAVHVDSWEAGDLNFTPNFVEEFIKRRGYDPTPFLLVHGSGRVVDSPEISDRFLWDVRRTIADLLADNYFGKMHELCHQRELKFQGEIAGVMVQTTVDQLQIKGRCDLPMGEFQMPNWLYGDHWARWDSREAASGAHIHNKPIAGAEAFTGFDRWMTDPYGRKGIGDLAFAMGINQLVFHTWALHPWKDHAPGMTMGPFGVNFSRLNTWWGRPAKVYFDYLRRCQYMLQQGQFVADILYFYGEGAPNTMPSKNLIKPVLPDGYSYDGCDAGTLLSNVEVKNNRLVLPNGLNYRILVLKEDKYMSVEVLTKIKQLAYNGATIIGPKPLKSTGLKDYPQCDEKVHKLADELWGSIDGVNLTERTFGKGGIIWGPSIGEVLKSMKIDSDVEITNNKKGNSVEWIHRCTGDADIYFVSNQKNIIEHGSSHEIWDMRYDSFQENLLEKDAAEFTISFRISDKQPELWDAVSGLQRDLPEFRVENGRTVVPLSLAPSGSCFIVFRKTISGQTKLNTIKNFPGLKKIQEIEGPWTVAFDPNWGGPVSATFAKLEDWTKQSEPGIKYYSGTATYRKTFDLNQGYQVHGKKVFLDLGMLRSLAEVRLNGKDLGVLWCPPWRVEITGLLKPSGNKLEIDITNVWANRIIGDASLPKEKQLTWTSLSDTRWALNASHKLIPSGLLGPVAIYVE